MNEILVDTNILIYSTDEDSKYFKQSQKLLFESGEKLYTSSKNISEFLSVITRHSNNPISIDDALVIVKDFTEIFDILYPSDKSFIIFRNLLIKYKPTGLKIHDFEIISIALSRDIKRIATLNKKDFTGIDEIEIISI